MKSCNTLATLAFAGTVLLASSVAATSGETDKPGAESEVAVRTESKGGETAASQNEPDVMALRRALDAASSEIVARLHMPAMLEVSDDPGEEAEIMELHRSGWIVEATVEEVEAAMKAAALTPGLDDDRAARTLAHRASCRFFYNQ